MYESRDELCSSCRDCHAVPDRVRYMTLRKQKIDICSSSASISTKNVQFYYYRANKAEYKL